MQEMVSSAAVLGSAIDDWLSDQVGRMLLGHAPLALGAPAKAVAQSVGEVITGQPCRHRSVCSSNLNATNQ